MSTPEAMKDAVAFLQEARRNVLHAMSVCGDEETGMCQDISDDLADIIAHWSGQPRKVVETRKADQPMTTNGAAAQKLSDAFDSMQETQTLLDAKQKVQLKFILSNLDTLIKDLKAPRVPETT